MKKIIGVLGVAVIAATMFFNTNAANGSSSDTSLASLMNMNVAHADGEVVKCENGIREWTVTYTKGFYGWIKTCVKGGSECC